MGVTCRSKHMGVHETPLKKGSRLLKIYEGGRFCPRGRRERLLSGRPGQLRSRIDPVWSSMNGRLQAGRRAIGKGPRRLPRQPIGVRDGAQARRPSSPNHDISPDLGGGARGHWSVDTSGSEAQCPAEHQSAPGSAEAEGAIAYPRCVLFQCAAASSARLGTAPCRRSASSSLCCASTYRRTSVAMARNRGSPCSGSHRGS
jgi:hypothetical protein